MFVMIYGPPGIGKTTLLSRYAFKNYVLSKLGRPSAYKRVFANFPCRHTFTFDVETDFGSFDLSDSLILIDEASIVWNNRKFKTLSQKVIQFAKLARHYKCDIVMCSQAFNDTDVTFTRLATRYYLLRKCVLFPHCVKAMRIIKSADIDESTHQPIDGFTFDPWYLRPFTTKRYYMPMYWHMFDSWDAPPLPEKEYPYIP